MAQAIEQGWYQLAEQQPSPNCNQRPSKVEISLLVIHNISLPPGEYGGGYIERFFLNKLPVEKHPYFETIANLQVSAHCLIQRSGGIVQFVPFHKRAWHAGESVFQGRENCNDFSIGIELEGTDTEPYTDQQYQALVALTKAIIDCFPNITPQRIKGHCDIAPDRKSDPGPVFNWARYLSLL